MSTFIFENNASTTLAGPISSTATAVTVASGTGAEFPNPGTGEQYALTFNDAATGLLTEICYVTARSGDTMTIARAQEGTVAQSWLAGDLAANLLTAGQMNAMFQTGTYQGQVTAAYLEYVGAAEIKLAPQGGNTIIIDGLLLTLPNSGMTSSPTGVYVNGVASQNLADNTVYDLFVFSNAGAPTFDFWSTLGHMPDTSTGNIGVEVRSNGGSPDSTRSYVGKIATNSSGQFQAQGIGVISWFNAKAVVNQGSATPSSTNTTSQIPTWTELTASARVSFLTFGGRIVRGEAFGPLTAPSGNEGVLAVGLDSATAITIGTAIFGSSVTTSMAGNSFFSSNALAEGQHFVTVLGSASASGGTVNFGACAAQVTVQG